MWPTTRRRVWTSFPPLQLSLIFWTTTTVTCTVCGRNHLAALHRTSETEIPSAKQIPEPAHTTVTNSLTMSTKLCGDLSVNKNCSKTLLVELTMEGIENKSLQCYAIVDEQSNTTLVDEYVVEFLGKKFPLNKIIQ